jgi:hypothetical protein
MGYHTRAFDTHAARWNVVAALDSAPDLSLILYTFSRNNALCRSSHHSSNRWCSTCSRCYCKRGCNFPLGGGNYLTRLASANRPEPFTLPGGGLLPVRKLKRHARREIKIANVTYAMPELKLDSAFAELVLRLADEDCSICPHPVGGSTQVYFALRWREAIYFVRRCLSPHMRAVANRSTGEGGNIPTLSPQRWTFSSSGIDIGAAMKHTFFLRYLSNLSSRRKKNGLR